MRDEKFISSLKICGKEIEKQWREYTKESRLKILEFNIRILNKYFPERYEK